MSSKGPNYEREICDQLSGWWTGNGDARVFWRSSGSGGMATRRNRRGKKTTIHCADVCAIDPVGDPLMGLLAIEIKRGYSKFSFQDLLDKKAKAALQEYEEWILQAEAARANADARHWLIILRRNARDPLVLFPYKFLVELHKAGTCHDDDRPFALLQFTLKDEKLDVCCLRFEAFLAQTCSRKVRALCEPPKTRVRGRPCSNP